MKNPVNTEVNDFYDYRITKPDVEGWYLWRVQNKHLDDVTLVFLAKFRERGAGHKNVLSPEFDYWNGYQVLLPKGPIEWATYSGEPPKPGYDLLEVVGLNPAPCPFCKNVPILRYSSRFIGSGPVETEYFYLECCHWFDGFASRMNDPRQLVEKRNVLLREYAALLKEEKP